MPGGVTGTAREGLPMSIARYHLAMPRFSIKRLLLATTLIAVGMGLVWFAYHDTPDTEWAGVFAFLAGIALIAAGLAAPFKSPAIAALVMLLVFFLILIIGMFIPAVQ
jgi:hypothetical protein